MVLQQEVFFFSNAFTTVDYNYNTIKIHSVAGSYVTDPIKYLNVVLQHSPFIIIGGDCGGGSTKLGITYLNKRRKTQFTALLIFNQKDEYESFNYFNQKDILQFAGDSIQFHTVYEVLQHMINIKRNVTFLNGDWNSINALSGLSTACAHHPCSICFVHKSKLVTIEPQQSRSTHIVGEYSQLHPPLLHIESENIVPLPLHLFIGIVNKVIRDVLVDELGIDYSKLQASIKRIKSVSSSPGASSIHALNGKEAHKWVKTVESVIEPPEGTEMKVAIVCKWMRGLGESLFHRKVWSRVDRVHFSSLVHEMLLNWEAVTNNAVTPKIHMLIHAVQFVELHHALGTYTEAHIESYHAKFNNKYRVNHKNKGRHEKERIRRTHADLLLQSIKDLRD
jgi:hypothetical protein